MFTGGDSKKLLLTFPPHDLQLQFHFPPQGGRQDKGEREEQRHRAALRRAAPHLSEQDKEFQHRQPLTTTTQQHNNNNKKNNNRTRQECHVMRVVGVLNPAFRQTTSPPQWLPKRKLTDDIIIITPTQNSDLQAGQPLLHLGVDVPLAKVHGDGLGLHLVALLCEDTQQWGQLSLQPRGPRGGGAQGAMGTPPTHTHTYTYTLIHTL